MAIVAERVQTLENKEESGGNPSWCCAVDSGLLIFWAKRLQGGYC